MEDGIEGDTHEKNTASHTRRDSQVLAVDADANGTTDYFEMYVQQRSGVDKILSGGIADTFFQGCKID